MSSHAIPTFYKNIRFRSRLEAKWAAFFDLAGWKWKYEPVDLPGWIPDFWVSFPCGHSECYGSHELYVEVKPYFSINQFKGHPAHKRYEQCLEPSGAMFGVDPSVSLWTMGHGAGGGEEVIENWVPNWKPLWAEACNTSQWKGGVA